MFIFRTTSLVLYVSQFVCGHFVCVPGILALVLFWAHCSCSKKCLQECGDLISVVPFA